MQLNLRSNHAVRLLMYCALAGDRAAPVSEIARAGGMSEAHLAKIANRLAAMGVVETQRGRGGGVRLARPAETIRLGEVIRGTEDGASLVPCMDGGEAACPLTPACRLRDVVTKAEAAFYSVLDACSVADLVVENGRLIEIFGLRSGIATEMRLRATA